MKKIFSAAIVVFLAVSLCSCESLSSIGYDAGFDDGYNAGYNHGYNDGQEKFSDFGWYFEEEAIDYVRDHNGWHPEEAVELIDAYLNNEPFYSDGRVPTEEEYLEAINSLIYFFDYFHSAKYK